MTSNAWLLAFLETPLKTSLLLAVLSSLQPAAFPAPGLWSALLLYHPLCPLSLTHTNCNLGLSLNTTSSRMFPDSPDYIRAFSFVIELFIEMTIGALAIVTQNDPM